jgi:hypothetical protein
MRSEPDGLGFEVCERLDTLKKIFCHLKEIDATHPLLQNILAVMKAYMIQVWHENTRRHGYLLGQWSQIVRAEAVKLGRMY